MEAKGIFGGTIPTLEKTLDLRMKKHQLITANITHVDTPNFKAFDMMVEDELKKSSAPENDVRIYQTHPDHLPLSPQGIDPEVTRLEKSKAGSERSDGNTVDIDQQMASLAENTILYEAQTQIISNKFKGLRNVIKGGK